MDYSIPTQTTFSYPSASTISPTSLTTSFVDLHIRATSSDDDDSSSSSKSTTRHSSTTSKCTDKQRCQTGQDTSTLTIALATIIPTVVFLCIIAAFMYRSYRKGKEESKDDDDPDFYGETTILPDYPHMPAASGAHDDNSLYSSGENPFSADNARYPSAAMAQYGRPQGGPQSRNMSRGAPSMATVQADPYYESFTLPYQHNIGSKQSLEELAKHMGSQYQAYEITSRPQSPYTNRSANSSAMNLTQQGVRNLTEKSTNSYEGETTDSPYSYTEGKVDTGDGEENVFADPKKHQYNYDPRRDSDMSYLEDEPENLNSHVQETGDVSLKPETEELKPLQQDPQEPEEEDENIKRMRSVYKVYFDRENSVKKPAGSTRVADEEAPPLPQIETSFVDEDQDEEENDAVGELGGNFLGSGQEKKQRVVSSIYSTVPLPYGQYAEDHNPQQQLEPSYQPPPQQYQQQAPQQYYQQPQPNIYQPPPQPRSQPGSQRGSPRMQTQFTGPPPELPPLQTIPEPNKIGFDSVVTNTDYAPAKSLTSANRPSELVKPFNPLHHSDQLFQPASPRSASSPQFNDFQAPPDQKDSLNAPSPHHIDRHSIVMLDPVGIGKQKIYRPAGAFSQMNSANSSRAGSLTSQSGYAAPQGSSELPSSGSQSDLRKQLGASDNYNWK